MRTKLIWVETSTLPANMGVKAHTHDYFHLYYVTKGECNFVVQDNPYVATNRDLVIAMPGAIHEFQVNENAKLLEIKFSAYDQTLADNLSVLSLPVQADVHTDYFINFIVNNGRSRLQYFIDSVHQYLNTLLIHLTRSLHVSDITSANSQLIDTTGFSKVSINIIKYIEEYFAEKVKLETIANTLDYNKHYLCTAFKKDTGITIIDYLNFVRIRHAAELFSYSDKDLQTICQSVGFTNLSHFNHTFKKLTGMPPGQYKRMFPVDISGNLQEGSFLPSNDKNQIQKISEIFGTLHAE